MNRRAWRTRFYSVEDAFYHIFGSQNQWPLASRAPHGVCLLGLYDVLENLQWDKPMSLEAQRALFTLENTMEG